jgi:1-acyl-sn-glycerol-3-phosphate acyltransferase
MTGAFRKIGKLFSLFVDIVWQYLSRPIASLKNTGIILLAFWRTFVVGVPAIYVLFKHRHSWSVSQQSRYIWNVAQTRWAPWILDRAKITVIQNGMEHFAKGPYIVVTNHASVLDILVTVGFFPDCRFVAKKEILNIPIIGQLARYGGQAIIDRSDKAQAMSAMRENIRATSEGNLLVFPEGTRTNTGELGVFKYGAFAIAKENQMPILPIAISGSFQALKKKGNFLYLESGCTIFIDVCRPISVSDVNRFEAPILAELARSIIAEQLNKRIA